MLIIVAIVLLIVLPSPWNIVGFGLGLALGIVEIFGWNQTVKRQRRVVGAQTLVGREAVVVDSCRPDGQVRIVSRDSLVLTVEQEN